MPTLSKIKNAINAELIAVAQQDPAFRQALLTNPKAAIQKRFGVSLPPEIELNVVEETATTNYLVLPVATGDELSEADLEAVAGGTTYQAWFTCLKSCADSKGQVQGELARFR